MNGDERDKEMARSAEIMAVAKWVFLSGMGVGGCLVLIIQALLHRH